MLKGEKRHFSKSTDAKWFAPPAPPENEPTDCESCTTTGIMQSQVQMPLSQALNSKRFPKWRTQQHVRDFPHSVHDNKHALKDSITVFSQGVGRRKQPLDRSEFNSYFCLCHDGVHRSAVDTGRINTVYNTEFVTEQAVDSPPAYRRFPRDHKRKSAEAALAQEGEHYLWFGRHDLGPSLKTLQVQGETTQLAPSKL